MATSAEKFAFSVPLIIVTATLLICAWYDFRQRRIPNRITYPSLALAILFNSLVSASGAHLSGIADGATPHATAMLIGAPASLFGALVCFLAMLLLHATSGGGAGDVKLAAVIGAWLGAEWGLLTIGYTFILAGLAAAVYLIMRIGVLGTFKEVACALHLVRPSGPKQQATPFRASMPLAPFFAVGSFLVLLEFQPLLP